MKYLSIMIKPASSLCNLQCKYCFYADEANLRSTKSFGIMSEAITNSMLKNIKKDLQPKDHVTFVFQGGEPTLAGLSYFHHFVAVVAKWDKEIHVEYALQTNAILLDELWCQFFKEHHFLIGVSFDILPSCHDSMRLHTAGSGTYKHVKQAILLLEKFKVNYNILCTLTNQIARHPQKVWKQILQLDLKYVQFTPCLDEMERPEKSFFALTPERFSSFYSQLFLAWYTDYKLGKYRSIKLFDDIIHRLASGISPTCGMGGYCQPQFVIEADGSVYPCDFYCLDTYRLGNILEHSILELLSSPQMTAFHIRKHPSPELCKTCDFSSFCGGGCKRMQHEVCCSEKDSFCGYYNFLKTNIDKLLQIAHIEKQFQT